MIQLRVVLLPICIYYLTHTLDSSRYFGCTDSTILILDEIVPRHPSVHINQINRPYIMQACNQRWFKINIAETAQP